jgi:hypothetical protein
VLLLAVFLALLQLAALLQQRYPAVEELFKTADDSLFNCVLAAWQSRLATTFD